MLQHREDLAPPRHVVVVPQIQHRLVRAKSSVAVKLEYRRVRPEERLPDGHTGVREKRVLTDVQELGYFNLLQIGGVEVVAGGLSIHMQCDDVGRLFLWGGGAVRTIIVTLIGRGGGLHRLAPRDRHDPAGEAFTVSPRVYT